MIPTFMIVLLRRESGFASYGRTSLCCSFFATHFVLGGVVVPWAHAAKFSSGVGQKFKENITGFYKIEEVFLV